ncbi:hypothetical protein AKJ42_01635 [candidate division MSBL1 archaeon SCGC-AAA261C02]|uniref:DUF2101 domain-containing protein n=1 Tax=candidate division MSBL1 archaeon SCGC-AAA261C02 TaxID=1698272 RepID=A0A133V0X6_9EURY|nr:hypothetical protein AKJ42_01635 [candidate division MSBL1 archaeon SCGC-AAA261C02]
MTSKCSKLADFFRKIGEAILSVRKLPSKLKWGTSDLKEKIRVKKKSKAKPTVPKILQGFFEQRHAGWPEYVILKVQICVIILFAISAIFAIFPGWTPEVVFIPLILILVGYTLYLVPTQLKRAFKQDYPAYRAFIGIILIIVFVLVVVLRYISFGIVESPQMALVPVILVIGSILGAFAAFRVKYGRNYTYGVVQRVRDSKAAVRITYDIRSNVKHGLHFLETLVKVKSGDRVKVGVERSMWGLRGSEPTTILERVK